MPPLLTFRRSTTLNDATNTTHQRRQSTSGGYHGNNNNSNGYYGSRGRGGGYGTYGGSRYGSNSHDMSAACQLQQQLQGQARQRVPVFAASAASSASAAQPQPTDRQEISEPATIIWCEGGVGEVMSPTVWRSPNLHVYFDATKTRLESDGGWEGLTVEMASGMEMDVTFSLSQRLQLQLLQQERQAEGGAAADPTTHTFVCIEKIAELRASRCSSLRTYEQAVVIARRPSGAAFLINNSGERTVLHPNFLPVDGVRHAILEKAHGQRAIAVSEVDDTPSSLCVLGRSLAVRLAPAPCWLPTINYDTREAAGRARAAQNERNERGGGGAGTPEFFPADRGVTRWALSAEPYGEEKQGRAVVVEWSRHSITLCPVEGDLAGRRTSLHAPIIQMTGQIKQDVQQVGSIWRFRACRELPGRAAVWRAFQLEYELESDPPLSEAVIEAALSGNRLIELEPEEEEWEWRGMAGGEQKRAERKEEPAKRASSMLDDLAQLQLVFSAEAAAQQQLQPLAAAPAASLARPPSAAAPTEMPLNEDGDDSVLVFDSIDDLLDSSTFADDVFKAPAILKDEWLLLGVPPGEAIKTEQELLLVDAPRCMRDEEAERAARIFTTGDERPDMRVVPKPRKKKRRHRLPDSDDDYDEEKEVKEAEQAARRARDSTLPEDAAAPGDSASQDEQEKTLLFEEREEEEGEQKSAAERRREAKENYRLKRQAESNAVTFATDGDDIFSLMHGGPEKPPAAAAAAATSKQTRPAAASAAAPPPVIAAAAASSAAPAAAPVLVATSSSELFGLFQGEARTSAAGAAAPSLPAAADKAAPSAAVATAQMVGKPKEAPSTSSSSEEEEEERTATAAAPAAPVASAAAATASAVVRPVQPVQHEPLLVVIGEPPAHPAGPRFDWLAYPERPRHADGWWWRPTRPRPPPVESRKEKRKKRREVEEKWRRQQQGEEDEDEESRESARAASPPHAPDAYEQQRRRAPVDDMRARLLGALAKKKEEVVEKPTAPLAVATAAPVARKTEEEERGAIEENVLVDLSPTAAADSPSSPLAVAAAVADSAPFPSLQPLQPTELHADLKDLF